jgi:hypothetical protein
VTDRLRLLKKCLLVVWSMVRNLFKKIQSVKKIQGLQCEALCIRHCASKIRFFSVSEAKGVIQDCKKMFHLSEG